MGVRVPAALVTVPNLATVNASRAFEGGVRRGPTESASVRGVVSDEGCFDFRGRGRSRVTLVGATLSKVNPLVTLC
jgi:hypothetical protein